MTHFAAAQLDRPRTPGSAAELYTVRCTRRLSGGGTKFDSDPRIRTPNHVARLVEIVVPNKKHEVVGNAELACNLETSAGPRHVAYPAIYGRGTIECDRAPFQGTQALHFASFVHCSWPASSNPWPSSTKRCVRRHDVVCDARDRAETLIDKPCLLIGR